MYWIMPDNGFVYTPFYGLIELPSSDIAEGQISAMSQVVPTIVAATNASGVYTDGEYVILSRILDKNGGSFMPIQEGSGWLMKVTIGNKSVFYNPQQYKYVTREDNTDALLVMHSRDLMKNFNDSGYSEKDLTHQEKDLFKTRDETALAFGLKYYGKSVSKNREYAAYIYKSGGKFYFNNVVDGKESSAELDATYAVNNSAVAWVHTHGNSNSFLHEYFTTWNGEDEGDLYVSYGSKGIDAYLITPSGALKHLNYNTYKKEMVAVGRPITETKGNTTSLIINKYYPPPLIENKRRAPAMYDDDEGTPEGKAIKTICSGLPR